MEVETEKDSWSSNGLRFATAAEAERAADELLSRWTEPISARATETPDEPVNYKFPLGESSPSRLPVPAGWEAV